MSYTKLYSLAEIYFDKAHKFFDLPNSILDAKIWIQTNECGFTNIEGLANQEGVYLGTSIDQNLTYLAEINNHQPAYILDYNQAVIFGTLPTIMLTIADSPSRISLLSKLTERPITIDDENWAKDKPLMTIFKRLEEKTPTTNYVNTIIKEYIEPNIVALQSSDLIIGYTEEALSQLTDLNLAEFYDPFSDIFSWYAFAEQDTNTGKYKGWLGDEERYQRVRTEILDSNVTGICGDWSKGNAMSYLENELYHKQLKVGTINISNILELIEPEDYDNLAENIESLPKTEIPLFIRSSYCGIRTTKGNIYNVIKEEKDYQKEMNMFRDIMSSIQTKRANEIRSLLDK